MSEYTPYVPYTSVVERIYGPGYTPDMYRTPHPYMGVTDTEILGVSKIGTFVFQLKDSSGSYPIVSDISVAQYKSIEEAKAFVSKQKISGARLPNQQQLTYTVTQVIEQAPLSETVSRLVRQGLGFAKVDFRKFSDAVTGKTSYEFSYNGRKYIIKGPLSIDQRKNIAIQAQRDISKALERDGRRTDIIGVLSVLTMAVGGALLGESAAAADVALTTSEGVAVAGTELGFTYTEAGIAAGVSTETSIAANVGLLASEAVSVELPGLGFTYLGDTVVPGVSAEVATQAAIVAPISSVSDLISSTLSSVKETAGVVTSTVGLVNKAKSVIDLVTGGTATPDKVVQGIHVQETTPKTPKQDFTIPLILSILAAFAAMI